MKIKRGCKVKLDSVNFNTYIGENALASGYGNASYPTRYTVAIGYHALRNNQPDGTADAGLYNTAVGCSALEANTTGHHNTALGFGTLKKNTTGYHNVALGEDALYENLTAIYNVAIGGRAMQNATGANRCIAIGVSALLNMTGSDSDYNVAIGYQTGISNFGSVGACVTDDRMTLIGSMAGVDKTADENAVFTNGIAIGYRALVNKSNSVRLGNSSVTVVESYGDFESLTIGKGFVCMSPNGTRYRITVADGGGSIVIAAA